MLDSKVDNDKNKKPHNRYKKIIAIIVAVFVILGIGGYVFVREGKKIANTSTIDTEIFEKDGKLYFTDSTDKNIVFCHNPQNGETQTLPYEKVKYENSEYKFIQDSKVLKSINKASGEEYCIFDIKKAKEKDGYADNYGVVSFSVSDIYEYNKKLYFNYTELIREPYDSKYKRHFYSYDPSSKSIEPINLVDSKGIFTINDKYLYYVGKNDQALAINRVDLDNMQQITLVSYPLAEYPDISIDLLSYCEKGLYYRARLKSDCFSLCLLDSQTGAPKSIDFEDAGLSFVYNKTDKCFYALTFEDGAYREVYKVNENFDGKKLLCEKIELPFKPEYSTFTSPVALGDKVYFGVYSHLKYDDSYAIYSVSQNGEIHLIKKNETHFMRKIFSREDTK